MYFTNDKPSVFATAILDRNWHNFSVQAKFVPNYSRSKLVKLRCFPPQLIVAHHFRLKGSFYCAWTRIEFRIQRSNCIQIELGDVIIHHTITTKTVYLKCELVITSRGKIWCFFIYPCPNLHQYLLVKEVKGPVCSVTSILGKLPIAFHDLLDNVRYFHLS